MGFYTPAEIEAFSRSAQRAALLVEFHFAPERRFWNGDFTMDFGGVEWMGLGGLLRIEGLAEIRSAAARQVVLTLTGTNEEFNSIVMSDADNIQQKLLVVYRQALDMDWQATGPPYPIYFGLCQKPSASYTGAPEGQPRERSLSIPSESLFAGRARPPAGRFTDRDQKRRSLGDRFFENVSKYKFFRYVWQ